MYYPTLRNLVVLDSADYQKVVNLAVKRNAKEKVYGPKVYDKNQPNIETHLMGILGEYVVAQLLGLEVDQRIFDHGGDEGFDLSFGDKTLEVKMTKYLDDPYLRIEQFRYDPKVYGYILCAVDQATLGLPQVIVHVVGWATAEMVKKGKQRRLSPRGPLNYLLSESDLLPMGDLIQQVTEHEMELA